jgi:hypothetical protein
MALPGTSLPYGMRQVRITPFTDQTTTVYAGASIPLPNSQTFTFADTEDFQDLRGDDQTAATHGKGTIVDWELEAGGISLEAYQALAGGVITTSGVTPNLKKRYSKYTTDATDATKYTRPYFKAEGRAISDSGGDFHLVVYRARATDDIKGELKDGEFWITGAKGRGLGSLVPADLNLAYDLVFNETPVVIP